jgi:alkylation response protein AidB-like acyl-CoA dehydrogenase
VLLKIRQQFNISVGKFEGVQEATSEIASDAYMLEAFRYLVTCGLNQGGTPAVMTAMAKYYATETMRKVVNHGMDIAGGRAIQLGPRNFLALPIKQFNCYYGRRRKYFNPFIDDFWSRLNALSPLSF